MKPRSFLLPLTLILLLSLSLLFISNSLHDRVKDLQIQLDNAQIDNAIMYNELGDVLSANDHFLLARQNAIGKEVKRLGINQETLLIQVIEPADEEDSQ